MLCALTKLFLPNQKGVGPLPAPDGFYLSTDKLKY